LILCSGNVEIISVETDTYKDSLINRKFKRTAFRNVINVFNQFNASFLNKINYVSVEVYKIED